MGGRVGRYLADKLPGELEPARVGGLLAEGSLSISKLGYLFHFCLPAERSRFRSVACNKDGYRLRLVVWHSLTNI